MSRRGWKRNLGLFTCPDAATDVGPPLPKGRPKGSGSSRSKQKRAGTQAAADVNQKKAATDMAYGDMEKIREGGP